MKLKFAIVEDSRELPTHSLLDLCDFLNVKVLAPLLRADGADWDLRFLDFLGVDDYSDPTASSGMLRLKVPPALRGRTARLEEAVSTELGRLGIRTGIVSRKSAAKAGEGEVLLIPIRENPTAVVAPPEVNVAYARGCVVMQDLLGYEPVNGRYEIAADELLERAASVTEEKIAACTASPVKVSKQVSRVPSAAGTRSLKRCLDEIRRLAEWAVSHNYQKLAAT